MLPLAMRLLFLYRLPVLAFLFLLGCDSSDPAERLPREAGVLAFEVDFRMDEAAFAGSFASAAFEAPEISPGVVEDGAVLAYYLEGETWTALPYTYGLESPDVAAVDYTVTLGYAYRVNLFEVFYEISLEDEGILRDLPGQLVKVVVLRGEAVRNATVNMRDYEAVRQHYGLAE